ncbi:putative mediator of rna polymerase ii transcription subunit 18 protein [Botrytis fragariae]|uniref:Mediator of RNA polymerase II transcription subunit 18 n=1 Tax=Botrytis fragariae TaxID=1964551 RepID=A0A8H6AL88_9HELO|nr:putative mediator of rna polymerase ii transcription subunit 18 protein [Botrytis fragariae]KAF5869353.1 putative mediator of rna polymerase ii transcription subunit 18 protein [Botrytis fragariae]
MHELFLSASVDSEDVSHSLRVLQGYCGMIPQHFIRRRLVFEGPRSRNNLKGLDPSFLKAQPPNKQFWWKSLNEQLIRQSYVLTLIYDVDKSQFGQPAKELDGGEGQPGLLPCDEVPGTLRWTDLPDPANAAVVNSRMFIAIDNEKSLSRLLQASSHRFTREIIQESHRTVHNNTVFTLSRYFEIPSEFQEVDSTSRPKVNSRLPPFELLEPFDADDKWILTASIEVQNGADPDHMKSAMAELSAAQEEFKGCFALKAADRHTFDTKVKVQA